DLMSAAEPQLAAHFVGEEELEGLMEACFGGEGSRVKRGDGSGSGSGSRVIQTGVRALDGALGGGVEEGRIVGVWGDERGGAGAICRTLLVDSLLKYEGSMAAVVDTTGNFDVLALYRVILARLQDSPAIMHSLRSTLDDAKLESSVEDVAAKVLDRVKIMRVFDFIGVKEAVDEVRDELEGRRAAVSKTDMGKEQKPTTDEKQPPTTTTQPFKRTIVADSEDEVSDEEMLFDIPPSPTSNHPPPPPPTQTPKQETQLPAQTKFLLLTPLTPLLTPLLQKSQPTTLALTTPFLTSLSHLTRTHALYTLILNPTTTTPARPSSPLRNHPLHQRRQDAVDPPQSIFAGCNEVPVLLEVLGRMVDLMVLVGRGGCGKGREGKGGGGGRFRGVGKGKGKGNGNMGDVEMVGVMEVMGDRWAGRVGAWGAFREFEGGVRDV
ncbi:hypothetical protein J1614_005655, partial [Plenodomus biglobosus]